MSDYKALASSVLGVDVEWILEYQKMLEAHCPPEWDERTRNFMLLAAPAAAVHNRYAPQLAEQDAEIKRLKAENTRLRLELDQMRVHTLQEFLRHLDNNDGARLVDAVKNEPESNGDTHTTPLALAGG